MVIRRSSLAAAFISLLNVQSDAFASGHTSSGRDPLSLYGPEIRFDVLRNGRPAGEHTVRFAYGESGVSVDSTFELAVDLLFVTVFRYQYRSLAWWQDGQLHSITTTVNDNGSSVVLSAVRDDARLTIQSGGAKYSVEAPVYPTNHWNAEVITQKRVLNTLTGNINDVKIKAAGEEAVETERGTIPAIRYVYTGDLQTEVWYDAIGRWVKMRFEARDGSTIEYVCRLCQGGTHLATAEQLSY